MSWPNTVLKSHVGTRPSNKNRLIFPPRALLCLFTLKGLRLDGHVSGDVTCGGRPKGATRECVHRNVLRNEQRPVSQSTKNYSSMMCGPEPANYHFTFRLGWGGTNMSTPLVVRTEGGCTSSAARLDRNGVHYGWSHGGYGSSGKSLPFAFDPHPFSEQALESRVDTTSS